MTGGDDDIAASLPRPPLPAPARREAAIKEALRRFDGGGRRLGPAGDRRPARPAIWARPYAGALAGAFMVALIGLPLVWTSFDNYAERRPAAGTPAPARTDPAPARTDPGPPPQADAAPPRPEPPAAADQVERPIPAKPGQADPAPAAPAAAVGGEQPVGMAGGGESDDIVVTGTLIRRPNLESTVPITVVGGDEISVAGRRAARAARRGDWNACTVEDPGRSLESCRSSVNTVGRGARGRAGAPLAEGLSKAWAGDLEAATAAFDRAIELSPRSSSAYLNRALAWRGRGDLDRALADLDRAVLYAPGDARAYYHRSLVHRQRGDLRRARADEERAVQLDPRYARLVRSR